MTKETKHKYENKALPIEERRKDYAKKMETMMNPFKNFNPNIFEPDGDDMRRVANRERIIPSKKLPIFNLKPKKIREGQMIGMYESKQDLYLTFAHRCNEMQKEIDLLKEEINLLKNK